MAQMFWVTCPECSGRFYCHTEDLWNAGYDLLCPYCNHTFPQEDGQPSMSGTAQRLPASADGM